MRAALALLLSMTTLLPAAEAPIYYLLWFDTEDYIEPIRLLVKYCRNRLRPFV